MIEKGQVYSCNYKWKTRMSFTILKIDGDNVSTRIMDETGRLALCEHQILSLEYIKLLIKKSWKQLLK